MEVISEKTYSVMEGEPHLGKQIETTVEVQRDEYMEAIIESILEGSDSTETSITVTDGDYEMEYTLGDDLTQAELDDIMLEMEMHLLDDDYGSGKDYDLVFNIIDDLIPSNWTDEFETVNMRGY